MKTMERNHMQAFEKYLTEKNDAIDSAAYQLACFIAATASTSLDSVDGELEWDMSCIGEIVDSAERILKQNGVQSCHPYYDDEERPCYMGKGDCKRKDCPFRAGNQ